MSDSRELTYSGPAWAWAIIFDTLAADARSPAFDAHLRQQISMAADAVELIGSEEPDEEEDE